MKELHGVHLLPRNRPVVAAVGMFDGVHLAHKALLARLMSRASTCNGVAALITFWPHPRHVLSGVAQPPLLSTAAERAEKLAKTGISYLITLPFDKQLSERSKDFFIEEVLIQGLGVRHLIVGPGHRFGKGGEGSLATLEARASRGDLSVEAFSPQLMNGEVISSTAIREALLCADLEKANQYLGYPYTLSGEVQIGQQIGREIGFPTANLRLLSENKLLPADGVYAVEAKIQDQWHKAMLYIGPKDLEGHQTRTIEVHIFDIEMNLYGKQLQLRLHTYLRAGRSLPSREALIDQLREDKQRALAFFLR